MLYPPRCPFCDRVLGGNEDLLCRECKNEIPFCRGKLCPDCGKPISDTEYCCQNCKQQEHSFISGRAALLYTAVMQESIARYKYAGRREYANLYGKLLWESEREWIAGLHADLLVPVPLHPERYRKRGYNQAALLADRISAYSGIPVEKALLLRKKKTLPQKELSWHERLYNLKQAFCINQEIRSLYESIKCVILIDDIYTTGSTVEACSSVLCGIGIPRIYFLSLCIGKDY